MLIRQHETSNIENVELLVSFLMLNGMEWTGETLVKMGDCKKKKRRKTNDRQNTAN